MANFSERRLIENEVLFRQSNELVRYQVERDYSRAERQSIKLQFYCECSDAACRRRIPMLTDEYRATHATTRHFTVLPGHEIEAVEKTVARAQGYNVVEKHLDPMRLLDGLRA